MPDREEIDLRALFTKRFAYCGRPVDIIMFHVEGVGWTRITHPPERPLPKPVERPGYLAIERIAKLLKCGAPELRLRVRDGRFPAAIRIPGLGKRWHVETALFWASAIKRDKKRARRDKSREKREKRERRGRLIYFMLAGGFIKIGIASKPERRLKELQTGSAEKIEILLTAPGDDCLERELHGKFAAHRVRPEGEWFHDREEIRAYIAAAREGQQ